MSKRHNHSPEFKEKVALEALKCDPPPLKWSAAMFRQRRTHDGK